MRRFKAEKARIVGGNDSIVRAAFQKGLPADHPLFGKLIMKEDLTLADFFSLADKHALWDEARQCTFKDLKKYPTSSLEAAKNLFACLTISKVAISSTIMREELEARLPIFYSSKPLLDTIKNSKANFSNSCYNPKA
ncbi:hypothetical protein FF1_014153 [Malus domestica]